eukprot:299236-Lingulodinium_polyedra.AAC.1
MKSARLREPRTIRRLAIQSISVCEIHSQCVRVLMHLTVSRNTGFDPVASRVLERRPCRRHVLMCPDSRMKTCFPYSHVGHMTLNRSIIIATANGRALLEPNPAKAVFTRMSGETDRWISLYLDRSARVTQCASALVFC